MVNHPLLSDGNTRIGIVGRLLVDMRNAFLDLPIERKVEAEEEWVYHSEFLDSFWDQLSTESFQLFNDLNKKKPATSTAQLRKTLLGELSKERKTATFQTLDFICYSLWTKRLIEVALDPQYEELAVEYVVEIPLYARDQVKSFLVSYPFLKASFTEKPKKLPLLPPHLGQKGTSVSWKDLNDEVQSIDIVTADYFEDAKISDQQTLRDLSIEFYLKFNQSQSVRKKVVANGIYIKPEPGDHFIVKYGDKSEELFIPDLIERAALHKPLLIKILNIGGQGKTTLLWHLLYSLPSQDAVKIYIKRIDLRVIEAYFLSIPRAFEKAIVFFLDEPIKKEENRKYFIRLGELMAKYSSKFRIAFIISERQYPYVKSAEAKELEANFQDHTFALPFSDKLIRNDIFERVYDSLNLALSPVTHRQCAEIFSENDSYSLIDRTFNLLRFLKKSEEIKWYAFEWEDWKNECKGRFAPLAEIFIPVAFFYQFGVSLPLDYVTEYFPSGFGAKNLIREFLGPGHEEHSPIQLVQEPAGKWNLQLRHEKLCEWYFAIAPGAKESAIEYFDKVFLNKIKSRASAYLFRNISRNNYEFALSSFKNYLPNSRILKVIDNYFYDLPTDSYGDEEFKMLMDKHFILLNVGENEKALEPLEAITKLKADNVHALVRLATVISEDDMLRAEQLFSKARKLKGQHTNPYILFGLLNLYYEHWDTEKLRPLQEEIFEIAHSNKNFTYRLLEFIEKNIPRLHHSIRPKLLELYTTYKSLGLRIVKVLIHKKCFKEAKDILTSLKASSEELSTKGKDLLASSFLKLYSLQNEVDTSCLTSAKEILESNRNEKGEYGPLTLVQRAKVLVANHPVSNYEEAEEIFIKAFDAAQTKEIFFAITKFYRSVAKRLSDLNVNATIDILQRGIQFIDYSLGIIVGDQRPLLLERIILQNELIEAHFSNPFAERSESTMLLIENLEKTNELFLEKSISSIASPESNKDFFSNYILNEEQVQYFAKACSLAYNYYIDKAKRTFFSSHPNKTEEVRRLYVKAKMILQDALSYDPDNPIIINNYVDTKIKLREPDLLAFLNEIDFARFSLKHSVRLCYNLIANGYKEYGIKFIERLGKLNSTDVTVKNDLAFCYIEAGMWSAAIRVLSDERKINDKSLTLIRRILTEMPVNIKTRIAEKIQLSSLHLRKSREHKRFIYLERLKTYFISGNRNLALREYQHIAKNLPIDNPKFAFVEPFERIVREYYGELVNYVYKNIRKAETLVDRHQNYKAGLGWIEKHLADLMKIEIDFFAISHILKNENEIQERIKTIFIKSVTIYFKLLNLQNKFSLFALISIKQLIINDKNPLFIKVFLSKLIKNNDSQLSDYQWLIRLIEHIEVIDYAIARSLGRYYLMIREFQISFYYIDLAVKLAITDNEIGIAHYNKADWTVTKLEIDIKDFGAAHNGEKKLRIAEHDVSVCEKHYPNFEFLKKIKKRIESLMRIYNT